VILRALEKQIAKKPVVATWDYEKGYECPICGYVVKQNQKYCSTCGQKLETDID
jgi:rubrerythrin